VRGEPSSQLPVRYFFQDESRFGLHTIERRKITNKGVQPKGIFQMTFEWYYLFGAIEPITGEQFLLELPYLNSKTFQLFVDEFQLQYSNTTNVMILDRGAFHAAKSLKIPQNLILLFLPPYSPELNPIERYWKHLKDQIPWRLFDDLQQLKDQVAMLIQQTSKEAVRSLTQFPFFMNAVNE
jgi:hypothetical protein